MTTHTTTTYEGSLAGLVSDAGAWVFEGAVYDTPATEADVIAIATDALETPDESVVKAASKLVFSNPQVTYTSAALLAIAEAYAAECDGGEGVGAVTAILRDAARRIAVIEALTV